MSKDYWAERQAQAQAAITDKNIEEVEKQLTKYYGNSMVNVIGQFEKTYNKLLLTIEEGRAPTPADLYKLDTYWQLQAQLAKELDKLGNKQAQLLSKKFMQEWEHIYKAIAIKDDLFFGEIDRQAAQQMINSIWCADGQTWSNRVWNNTSRLREALNENLIYCVTTGKKTTELKQLLQEQFGVSYNRANTLVRTEMAHIQTEAARARYKDAGITEVEVLADKDERRCDVCGKLHQKRYPINGVMPIPAHPKCRCSIIPVVE
jgi:SPP1 gp7 family putative phage head morphogenesis protein